MVGLDGNSVLVKHVGGWGCLGFLGRIVYSIRSWWVGSVTESCDVNCARMAMLVIVRCVACAGVTCPFLCTICLVFPAQAT